MTYRTRRADLLHCSLEREGNESLECSWTELFCPSHRLPKSLKWILVKVYTTGLQKELTKTAVDNTDSWKSQISEGLDAGG